MGLEGRRPRVQFEWAVVPDGEVTHIKDSPSGIKYVCLGCGQVLIARHGSKKAHHFAHLRPNQHCSPETVIHTNAKWNLFTLLTNRLRRGETFFVTLVCPWGPDHTVDLLAGVDDIGLERALEKTRPDILLLAAGQPKRVLEIVVHHFPEPDTLQEYHAKGIPVYTIAIPREGDFVADYLIFFHPSRPGMPNYVFSVLEICCHREEERQTRERAAEEAEIIRVGKRLSSLVPREPLPLRMWYEDKFGKKLFGNTRDRVWASGRRLLGAGFRQALDKPYLFYLRLPEVVVFANMGGTYEVAIWADPRPLLHWKFHTKPSRAIIRGVGRFLRMREVPTRLSFEEEWLRSDPLFDTGPPEFD